MLNDRLLQFVNIDLHEVKVLWTAQLLLGIKYIYLDSPLWAIMVCGIRLKFSNRGRTLMSNFSFILPSQFAFYWKGLNLPDASTTSIWPAIISPLGVPRGDND